MKRKFRLLLLFVTLISIGHLNVNAKEETLCIYGDNVATISYEPILKKDYMPDLNKTPGKWIIRYKKKGSSNLEILQNKAVGSFDDAFLGGDYVNFGKDKKKFPDDYEQNFACPEYINIEYDGPWHRVCFTNHTKEYNNQCEDRGKTFEYPAQLSHTADTYFNKINKFAESGIFDTYKTEDLIKEFASKEDNELLPFIKEKTKTYVLANKIFNTDYKVVEPNFVKNINNYIDNIDKYIDAENNQKFQKFLNDVTAYKQTKALEIAACNAKKQTAMTEEEKAKCDEIIDEATKEVENLNNNVPNTFYASSHREYTKTPISVETTCEGLLGKTVSKIVINVFHLIQYAGPILVGILTILDFSKAALSGDAEETKKASSKFIKRLICAILLFFVPLLCNMLFKYAGITVPEICIK